MLSDATPLFVYLVVHVLLLLYYSADDLCTHRRILQNQLGCSVVQKPQSYFVPAFLTKIAASVPTHTQDVCIKCQLQLNLPQAT